MGPLYREMPVPRAFLYIFFRVSSKGAFPPDFPHRSPIERERHSISRACFYCLLKSPVNEPPLQVPQWGSYGKRCPSPEPSFICLSGPPVEEPSFVCIAESLANEPPSRISNGPL